MSLFCRLSLMGNTNWPFRGYVYWSIFKYKRMLRYFVGFLRTFALLMDSWQVVTHHCPMLLFVCSPIFCTSTSTYVILSVRLSDTIDVFPASLSLTKWLASCFSAGSRLTPGEEAQGSFSIKPVKPRARAPGFQQTGHRTTQSAAFALSPPSPCLVPQCRTQTWTFPIWARLGENICTSDLYWKMSFCGSFASKLRKGDTLENLYFPIRRLPTSSPASYVPISTNQPACPTSFPTQPQLPCQPEQPVCSCLLPILVSQSNCLVCLQFVVLPVIQRTPYTS